MSLNTNHHYLFFVCSLLFTSYSILLTGCSTTPKMTRTTETREEVITAIENVTGAMAGPGGQEIKAKDLVRELRTNEEARTAMQAIAEGVAPQRRVIRYCPETGEHFGPGVKVCPDTGTPLVEIVEEN